MQARLARQLKEAMAERQAAKTASKGLQRQLDSLHQQVMHISVGLLCQFSHQAVHSALCAQQSDTAL